MMGQTLILFVLIAFNFCNIGYSSIVPEFIRPCNDTSTECLTKATQDAVKGFVKGLPHLGVPQLDPFIVEKLPIELAGITVTLYNGKITGFGSCIADKVSCDPEKRRFDIEFHCNLTVEGRYTAKGNLLHFPIDGDGDAKIDITNIHLDVNVDWKQIKDDKEQKYFDVIGYTYTVDYGDLVTFHLTNLFKDSKQLSDTIVLFLNQNWKTVVGEFGKPIMDTAADIAVNTIKKFFHAVLSQELIHVTFPDD